MVSRPRVQTTSSQYAVILCGGARARVFALVADSCTNDAECGANLNPIKLRIPSKFKRALMPVVNSVNTEAFCNRTLLQRESNWCVD